MSMSVSRATALAAACVVAALSQGEAVHAQVPAARLQPTPSAAPAPASQLRMTPGAAAALTVNPLQLQAYVEALKKQVAQLLQDNAALKAKLQQIDTGLGQVVTTNVVQAQQINSTNGRIDQLTAQFKSHKHTFAHTQVDFTTKQFVTESHVSGDKYGLATVITNEYDQARDTSAPNP